MTTNHENTAQAPSIEGLGALLNEIGCTAHTLNALAFLLADDDTGDEYHALFPMIQKIGFLADAGLRSMGAYQWRGEAENWFLPDSYLLAVKDLRRGGESSQEHQAEGDSLTSRAGGGEQ